ncbi:SHOCT domain-containing protein [Streptomyces anulatus]|uniref:SHOCT domain-containing protein n=1 Tax=Streptomyces anulatus TaxID=1892 RepID=UPI0036DCE092
MDYPLWTALVVVLPFLGCFVYLIARGKGMGQRTLDRARRNEREFQEHVRAAAGVSGGTTGHAEELSKLADLKNHGDITAAEYERAKEKVLVG